MKEHKKIIEKGVPEDVPPGIKGSRVSYMYSIRTACVHVCVCVCVYVCVCVHVCFVYVLYIRVHTYRILKICKEKYQ